MRVHDNFHLSDTVRGLIDGFAPRSDIRNDAEPLPYICWALRIRQTSGDRIVRESGPGYILGVIEPNDINENIVLALDNGRHIAFALNEPYDEKRTYLVDCVGRQFTIVAT